MEIFFVTKRFPKEELYSLSSQIVRSSRSISSNIAEGWAKRVYENKFKLHLIDSLGSTAETQNWTSFARDCNYINQDEFKALSEKLDHIGRMITKLHQNWKTKNESSNPNVEPPVSNL